MAVYFVVDGGLLPEYRELPKDDPIGGLIAMLAEGPTSEEATSAVPRRTRVLRAAEGAERILVGLDKTFWGLARSDLRKAAAQIVYTLGTLEDGKQITLLDGLKVGEVPGDGEITLRRPLSRSDFDTLRPWMQVVQPVAGSLVGDRFPLRLFTRRRRELVEATVPGRGGVTTTARDHFVDAFIVSMQEDEEVGWMELRDGRGHVVMVPLRFTD